MVIRHLLAERGSQTSKHAVETKTQDKVLSPSSPSSSSSSSPPPPGALECPLPFRKSQEQPPRRKDGASRSGTGALQGAHR
ncbi:hypothetical protein SprV_0501810300 [Sparganum proliferum]